MWSVEGPEGLPKFEKDNKATRGCVPQLADLTQRLQSEQVVPL